MVGQILDRNRYDPTQLVRWMNLMQFYISLKQKKSMFNECLYYVLKYDHPSRMTIDVISILCIKVMIFI